MGTHIENSAPQALSGEKLLTRAEVEDAFGFPTKRYLEIAAMGNDGPPIVRFGRTVRYRVSDLRGWIQSHCAQDRISKTE
jgi:predicted DNA-binding transcriptional regulator AlpA